MSQDRHYENSTPNEYFTNTVEEVFDDYFLKHGLYRTEIKEKWAVTYILKNCFFCIDYEPDGGPMYSPYISIGPLPRLTDDPAQNCVDVQDIVPESTELHQYNVLWRYSNADELKETLTRIRDEIIEVYVLPLLNKPNHLRNLLKARVDKMIIQFDKEVQEHNDSENRVLAEKNFRLKNYDLAIQYYEAIGWESLTKAEIKKLGFARKQINRIL